MTDDEKAFDAMVKQLCVQMTPDYLKPKEITVDSITAYATMRT